MFHQVQYGNLLEIDALVRGLHTPQRTRRRKLASLCRHHQTRLSQGSGTNFAYINALRMGSAQTLGLEMRQNCATLDRMRNHNRTEHKRESLKNFQSATQPTGSAFTTGKPVRLLTYTSAGRAESAARRGTPGRHSATDAAREPNNSSDHRIYRANFGTGNRAYVKAPQGVLGGSM